MVAPAVSVLPEEPRNQIRRHGGRDADPGRHEQLLGGGQPLAPHAPEAAVAHDLAREAQDAPKEVVPIAGFGAALVERFEAATNDLRQHRRDLGVARSQVFVITGEAF
jgi:hypothetical protein